MDLAVAIRIQAILGRNAEQQYPAEDPTVEMLKQRFFHFMRVSCTNSVADGLALLPAEPRRRLQGVQLFEQTIE